MPYPGTLSLNVINAYVNLKRGRGSILMFANMPYFWLRMALQVFTIVPYFLFRVGHAPGHLSETAELSRACCWHGAGYDEAYNIGVHIRAFMFQCWLLKWLDTQKFEKFFQLQAPNWNLFDWNTSDRMVDVIISIQALLQPWLLKQWVRMSRGGSVTVKIAMVNV